LNWLSAIIVIVLIEQVEFWLSVIIVIVLNEQVEWSVGN